MEITKKELNKMIESAVFNKLNEEKNFTTVIKYIHDDIASMIYQNKLKGYECEPEMVGMFGNNKSGNVSIYSKGKKIAVMIPIRDNYYGLFSPLTHKELLKIYNSFIR